MRVVVIGAGLGGLAAGVRLLGAGHEVTVVESRPEPGGRASRISAGGYRFDTGPSLLTMPEVLDGVFAAAGSSSARELRLHRLDPFYRIHWEGEGPAFDFMGDPARMREEIARFSAADAARYDGFVEASRRIYEEAILVAGRRPFPTLTSFAALVPRMVRLDAVRSVTGFVNHHFSEPHVRQVFDFHPLFIGGDPRRVPAVYAALAYLQLEGGVWYAEGGVWSVVEALARLVRSGGELRCGDAVSGIESERGRVTAVTTASGDRLPADAVISNADVAVTEALAGRAPRRRRLSMSCYLLYLGVKRRYPQLQHHTLLVGRDYDGFIADVTRRRRLPGSLSLYVHAPSRTEPAMAAPGGESLAVLLPVPNLGGGLDWERAEPVLRERVLDALESPSGLGLEGLRAAIEVERAWTPLTFRDELASPFGSAFGPEPLLTQSAYFRVPNQDRQLAGLYHVGAGVHPGAGVPGVLLGAEITAGLVGPARAAA